MQGWCTMGLQPSRARLQQTEQGYSRQSKATADRARTCSHNPPTAVFRFGRDLRVNQTRNHDVGGKVKAVKLCILSNGSVN